MKSFLGHFCNIYLSVNAANDGDGGMNSEHEISEAKIPSWDNRDVQDGVVCVCFHEAPSNKQVYQI